MPTDQLFHPIRPRPSTVIVTYISTLQLRLPMMRHRHLSLLSRRTRLTTDDPIPAHPITLIRRHPHLPAQMHRTPTSKGRVMRMPVVPVIPMQMAMLGMVRRMMPLVPLETEHPVWWERGIRHGQAVIGERRVSAPSAPSTSTAAAASDTTA